MANVQQITDDSKIPTFGSNKNLLQNINRVGQGDSVLFWFENYYEKMIIGGNSKTQKAKYIDLQKFLNFFLTEVGTAHIDNWTPSISRGFQKLLLSHVSQSTGKNYKATTINRIFATLKHCASWINERRPFSAGNPFEGIKDIMQDEPAWNGLTDRQISLIKAALDNRKRFCKGKHQNPLLETAVIYILLHTGLRKFELCSLTLDQYYNKGFHDIKRKGNMITKRVFLPEEARQKLDLYLEWRKDVQGRLYTNLLFINKYYQPLSETAVSKICKRVSAQACVNSPNDEKFILQPHQLRHTCLKRANDKYGISFAKKLSGNVGDRELYRYTAPSQEEIEEKADKLF